MLSFILSKTQKRYYGRNAFIKYPNVFENGGKYPLLMYVLKR